MFCVLKDVIVQYDKKIVTNCLTMFLKGTSDCTTRAATIIQTSSSDCICPALLQEKITSHFASPAT